MSNSSSRQLPIKRKSTMVRNRRTRLRLRRDATSRNVVDLTLLLPGEDDTTDAVAKEDCSSASVLAANGSSSSSCTKTMVTSGCIVMLACYSYNRVCESYCFSSFDASKMRTNEVEQGCVIFSSRLDGRKFEMGPVVQYCVCEFY